MEGLGRAPARAEADLRAALAELGQRAPSADDVLSSLPEDVLSALRGAGPCRQRRSPRLPRLLWPGQRRPGRPRWLGPGRLLAPRLGWPRLAVGAAAAVTAAAVTLALTVGGSPSGAVGRGGFPALPNPPVSAGGPPAVVSPGDHPSAASLARAMLTAFSAAEDDLGYETVAHFEAGHLIENFQTWSWPAVSSPGQVEYTRYAFSAIPRGAPQATAPLKPVEDYSYTAVVPHSSRPGQSARARVIMVCYAGTGQTGCGWWRFGTKAGTWSEHTGVLPYLDQTPSPRGADLVKEIARGQWRIVGHTRLRGQPAIKLAEATKVVKSDYRTVPGRPVFFWVSTASYLPLRVIWAEGRWAETDNWYYLPPTKANLAHLQVPIPPGYPRSG